MKREKPLSLQKEARLAHANRPTGNALGFECVRSEFCRKGASQPMLVLEWEQRSKPKPRSSRLVIETLRHRCPVRLRPNAYYCSI